MRNLAGLFVIISAVSLCAWFRAEPASEEPSPAPIAFTWQEWLESPKFVFVVTGRGSSAEAYFKGSANELKAMEGPWVSRLCAELGKEMEVALEETCRGKKTSELTLIQGSQSRTVEIGDVAGPAQSRLIDLIEKSPISRARRELLLPIADPAHLKH